MATFVIGDIHGRFETLDALLTILPWRRKRDHLWLTGDLVNRGPQSLEVLRWVHESHQLLGDRLVAVLGNHDLHLLSLHLGVRKPGPKHGDLLPILGAEDRGQLIDFLRHRPLLHRRDDTLLVHAGLLPGWSIKKALRQARQGEEMLRDDAAAEFLLGPSPDEKAKGISAREAEAWHGVAALTRLRTLDRKGNPCHHSGPPSEAPKDCLPWFEAPDRRSKEADILFGHWAALGLYQAPGVTCLDSGCAWGGHLTALRLDDRKLFQQKVLEPSAYPH